MVKCSFCGDLLPLGRGKIFVRTDNRVFYFDRPKCESNFRLGREGVNVKWTTLHRKKKAREHRET